nr:MAG TPA: hypothetical protein [Caudoviricetes sp.]
MQFQKAIWLVYLTVSLLSKQVSNVGRKLENLRITYVFYSVRYRTLKIKNYIADLTAYRGERGKI